MDLPKRKANRIEGYDYRKSGVYFVTVCTQNRDSLFSMEFLKEDGTHAATDKYVSNQIVHKWIGKTEEKYPGVYIDQYVIMPDHLHLLLKTEDSGASLPEIMHFFKTMTTNEYIREVKKGTVQPFHNRLWQKSYYDHVVRNQRDYDEIWEYIRDNPVKWLVMHEKIEELGREK